MTHAIDVSSHKWQDVYKYLVEIVQPRPIALVSSINDAGQLNLAPFSFYNVISCNPPLVAFSPQISGKTGEKKDTLKNIEQTKQFTIATVTESIAEMVNHTSTPYPYGVSEFEKSNLTPVPAQRVKTPLIKESPVNMECELVDIHSYGKEGGAGQLIVGEVVYIHISSDLLDENSRIISTHLKAVGRMGGQEWCTTKDTFEFNRPDR